jgi:hypothetical protein
MDDLQSQVEQAQREFCSQQTALCIPAKPDSKLGFALETRGRVPINGLRHPEKDDTSGWYIWLGESFSQAPDFFSPIHVKHIYEEYPELRKLLGLPPGYRFLLAGDYLDVWYDASLLNV